MNYRHAYHAGNFADVFKHIILTRIILYMQRKEAAFRIIDTHAGIGRYDLQGIEAGKTQEWQHGIGKLLTAKGSEHNQLDYPEDIAALLAPYLDIVAQENPSISSTDTAIRHYPGSPLVARRMLRPQDRLSALELHPSDAKQLAQLFEGDYQVRVTELDGWLALGAHLPPKERRGIVLVDPPFEIPGEFDRLVQGLSKAHKRFSGGTYALWYPVKDRVQISRFVQDLEDTGISKILRLELSVRGSSRELRFDGSGMIVVNPPYTLEAEMRTLLPWLVKSLAEDKQAGYVIDWIRGEDPVE